MRSRRSGSSRMRTLAAVALALAALSGATAAPGQPPSGGDGAGQIELRADVVLVNVVATRQGGFVQGLSRGDFAVSEDDVPQAIAFSGAETTPFTLAMPLLT